MKVLVTGLTGQLARSLVERGEAVDGAGIEIIAAGRPQIDLTKPGSAAEVIEAIRPDVVINAAAYTAVDQAEDEAELAFRVNADAAGEIAAAADRVDGRIVQVSTDYVFDGCSQEPYAEDAIPHPLGVYGESKLTGEKLVRAANPRHVIVRTAWVYSPFPRNFVTSIMDAARTRDVLTVVDDQEGNPTSAIDLADGLLRLVDSWGTMPEHGLGETYHLTGAGVTNWYKLAEYVMGECRKHSLASAEVTPIRTAEWAAAAARPANSAMDSSKFARDFGFIMPRWQKSVSAVVARLA
jgi:dTDP-4-dehydrorhamnose reductase